MRVEFLRRARVVGPGNEETCESAGAPETCHRTLIPAVSCNNSNGNAACGRSRPRPRPGGGPTRLIGRHPGHLLQITASQLLINQIGCRSFKHADAARGLRRASRSCAGSRRCRGRTPGPLAAVRGRGTAARRRGVGHATREWRCSLGVSRGSLAVALALIAPPRIAADRSRAPAPGPNVPGSPPRLSRRLLGDDLRRLGKSPTFGAAALCDHSRRGRLIGFLAACFSHGRGNLRRGHRLLRTSRGWTGADHFSSNESVALHPPGPRPFGLLGQTPGSSWAAARAGSNSVAFGRSPTAPRRPVFFEDFVQLLRPARLVLCAALSTSRGRPVPGWATRLAHLLARILRICVVLCAMVVGRRPPAQPWTRRRDAA